ncbi:MAG: HlyD family efflux transporter periplasmic adaptor subunit [Hyphomicrobiaceae bacterium]
MAVKVRRERPDQRRHHRVTAPLFVDVEGWRLHAADWSLGGLRVVDFPEQVPELGTRLDLQLTLPFQGFEIAFGAVAEVVRNDPGEGMFAVQFVEIGERERELMSHFIDELVRGSMVDIEGTINRIDVPVTPASLKPDASPQDEVPIRRWPIKTVVMSALYFALGFAVFGYLGLMLYTNLYKLEVQTAVVSAPVAEVRALADGRVVWHGLEVGAVVSEGQPLADITDTEIEREIRLADIAVQEQKARLGYLRRRLLDELERTESFATIEMSNVRQTRLRLDSLEAELATAELQRNRIQRLHAQGFATDLQRETAEQRVIGLRKQVEQLNIELTSRASLARNHIGKRLFTGNNVVGDLGDIEAQVNLVENEVTLSSKRRDALVAHRDRLTVTAPFDGRVIDIRQPSNTSVRRGDPLFTVERPRSRTIKAFLTQDDVLRVGLGDEADILIPGTGDRLLGRVVSIDRTAGFIIEQSERHPPGYSWRGPNERSAEVVIEIPNDDIFQTSPRFKPGTPVVVVFSRRSRGILAQQAPPRTAGHVARPTPMQGLRPTLSSAQPRVTGH